MVSKPANGQIITFYSYKGGTGRSMALANVAWILASAGKRVLTLDWDLEAPGLHRYFYPFLVDRDLTCSDGLIDFVLKFATAAMDPKSKSSKAKEKPDDSATAATDPKSKSSKAKEEPDASATAATDPKSKSSKAKEEPDDLEWYKPYTNILRYASSLNWKFGNGGSLDFIPAGRQGSSYSTRVNSFNWQNFYDLLGGGTLLELAKEKMRSEYDYVLIDSRTGVSDTSGICTVQMPDILVICFTLNNQSIEGATAVAHAVHEQRTKSERSLKIFPVAMRVENAEKIKLQKRKDYAKEKFKLFPNSLPGEERDTYWGETPVIYVPYYAYEEILAAFGDNSEDRISVLAAAEQLTSYITNGEVKKLVPASEASRIKVLAVYEGGPRAVSPAEEQNRFADSVFDSLSAEDKEKVRRVFTRLVRVAQPNEVGGDTLLRLRSRAIEPNVFSILRPLIDARLLELEQDGSSGSYMVKIAKESLLQDWKRLRGWINDDREFLLWRQRLQVRLEEWEKSNRDAGALLSGALLREAERWLADKLTELSDNELLFIMSSVEQRDKATSKPEPKTTWWSANWRRTLWRTLAVLGGLVLALALYAGYSLWQSEKRLSTTVARQERQSRASVHNNLGLEYLVENNFSSAIDSFNTAIDIDPQFADPYMNRGNVYRKRGALEKAIDDLTQAITLNQNYPNPYYYRGLAYRSQGNKNSAIADFQQCASLANDRYWIVNAKQRTQQMREGIDVALMGFDSIVDGIKRELELVGYQVTLRPYRYMGPTSIRYRDSEDNGNAEDIQELINEYLARNNRRTFTYVEQDYSDFIPNEARIGVWVGRIEP